MFKAAVGWADEVDSRETTDLALDMALGGMGGVQPQAALVFSAVDVDLEVVSAQLRARFPDLQIAGCSTDGEIASGEGFLEDSLVIKLFASDIIDFTVGIGRDAIADPAGATAAAVTQAKAGSDRPVGLCVTMLEGLGTNIRDLVGGLRTALGEGIPVVGGAAGDQLRFKGTRQMCNGVVTSDAVVVLMMHGPLAISSGVSTGYTPLGQSHLVTKAQGAVVHEIDGRPAAELYADYLQQPSIFYPLAVHDETRKSLVLSSPLNFDKDTGALHLVNPVAENSRVQLSTASREEIIDAARNAAGQAVAGFRGEKVEMALLFSCAGRRATLGTRTGEEFEAMRHVLGEGVPAAGFYCYGEISPEVQGGPSLSHTNAFVAILVGATGSA